MKKSAVQIAVLAGVLIAVCLICRFTFLNTYTAHFTVPEGFDGTETELKMTKPGILAMDPHTIGNDRIRIDLRPVSRGETFIDLTDRDGSFRETIFLKVGRFGTIYDRTTGGFTGETIVLPAVTLFFLLVSAIMLWNFLHAEGSAFYAYATIYYAGFFLFSLFTGAVMLRITILHGIDPIGYTMYSAYSTLNRASSVFMLFTMPFVILFSAALSFSNIILLRHEKAGLKNIIGIIIGFLLILSGLFGCWYTMRDFAGSEWEYRIRNTLENVYSTIYVYFECMLIGSIVCGIRAARHVPSHDREYIIILGCYFRPDGTLTPLLKGRVDRALDFWRTQKEMSGKEAYLIPSGGKGSDEPMPEAFAMKRYLLEQGIPERLILTEDQSVNTFENMARSRMIIQKKDPKGKAAFVTTNYHVFRSGVWSNMADLHAEGMGSRTKWWYWPNAFMREWIGLLVKRWEMELLLLAVLIAYFSILTMTLY